MKDEPETHIKEWVHYHRVVGVEHFCIYDNGSTIKIADTLKNEVAAGFVSVIPFPGSSAQMPSTTNFIHNYGKFTRFAAVIDADEFLVPKTKNIVPEILEDYDKDGIGAFNVSWLIFGSSGIIEKIPDDKLVIESYIRSMKTDNVESKHTKAILVRPGERALRAGSNPHYCVYNKGFTAVSEDFVPVPNAWAEHKSDKLVLHHYCLKSLNNFKDKIAKPRADKHTIQGKTLDDFYRFDKDCTEDNKDIFRFIPQVKEEMAKYK
jgi:hypothetical protein